MARHIKLPTRAITWGEDREEGEDTESCDVCGDPASGTFVDDGDDGTVFEYSHKCDECRNGLCDDCYAHAKANGQCTACDLTEMREEESAR